MMDRYIIHELANAGRRIGLSISEKDISLSTRLPGEWCANNPEMDPEVSIRLAFLYIVEDELRLPWLSKEQISCLEFYADLILFIKEHRSEVDRRLSGRA